MALLRHILLLTLVICAVLHANAASLPGPLQELPPAPPGLQITPDKEEAFGRYVGLIIHWSSPSVG